MIQTIGHYSLLYVNSFTEFIQLAQQCSRQLVWQLVSFRFRFRQVIDQCYSVGVQSLPVILFSMVFISLMLTLEFSYHMKLVLRQDSLVPAFSTLILIREIGPVVTCLLLNSRVGAGMAAEIGSMKITDQIDALRLLAIDPIDFLAVPRWVACVFGCAVLSLFTIGLGLWAGATISALHLGFSQEQYFNTMFAFARFSDIRACLVKAVVFGTIIPWMACHYGFRCRYGAEGVGNATTSAVVQSTIWIIVADFVLTFLLYAA